MTLKENYQEAINQIMNKIGVNVKLVLDINHACYVPVITTLPTYQGLVCGYCGLKNHKGYITPIIVGMPTNLSKDKIRKLDDMFDEVKTMAKECNNYIEDLNVEIRMQNIYNINCPTSKKII